MRARAIVSARNLVKLGLLSISLFWSVPMSASAEKQFPSMAVEEDEIRLPSESAFADACHRKARELATMGHWGLQDSVLTFSKKWGLIWRNDFTDPKGNIAPLVNRVICWRLPSDSEIQITVAVGQNVPPLRDFTK